MFSVVHTEGIWCTIDKQYISRIVLVCVQVGQYVVTYNTNSTDNVKTENIYASEEYRSKFSDRFMNYDLI